jgi:hypothetical protein
MRDETFQATGFAPFTIVIKDDPYCAEEFLEGDKRGVSVELFEDAHNGWWAALDYHTTWGTERPFTRISERGTLEEVSDWVRTQSKTVLPPGAGFPATPSFETRQSKLTGMMETLTLVALSRVLKEIEDDRDGQGAAST